MSRHYEPLGKHIRLMDARNTDMITDRLLGININKYFMPSVANIIGTDLTKYKLISKGQFACNPMHVGRDERFPVALYNEDQPSIVSPAYFMFRILDESLLLPDYLMMWFRREEFDRICWLKTDGSVRGGISWDDICRLELPVPPIEKQKSIVKAYQTITDRIVLKRKINDNLDVCFRKAYQHCLVRLIQNPDFAVVVENKVKKMIRHFIESFENVFRRQNNRNFTQYRGVYRGHRCTDSGRHNHLLNEVLTEPPQEKGCVALNQRSNPQTPSRKEPAVLILGHHYSSVNRTNTAKYNIAC